ncbi:hypothetical protein ACI78V_02100 [Geodermatophilus sp. SYSU D00742]
MARHKPRRLRIEIELDVTGTRKIRPMTNEEFTRDFARPLLERAAELANDLNLDARNGTVAADFTYGPFLGARAKLTDTRKFEDTD